MNLFSGMLMSTGVAATVGLNADVGGDETTDQATSGNVESGTPTGSTLFGMYQILTDQVSDFFNAIFPGLAMLNRAGVPGWITGGFLGPLFSVFIFVGILSFLRGWGL